LRRSYRHYIFSTALTRHLMLPSFPTRRSSDLVGSFLLLPSIDGVVGHIGIDRDQARLEGEAVISNAVDGELVFAEIENFRDVSRSEEHTSELQSRGHLVCRLLLEKKNNIISNE